MIAAIKNFIRSLDHRVLIGFYGGFLAVIILAVGTVFFYYSVRLETVQNRFRALQRQRDETRALLTEHALVKAQRTQVDELLAKDKSFKIVHYVSSIIDALQLSTNISKDPAVSEHDLRNGYSETQLDVQFKDMNMKQIVDFLYKIEQSERVYTKSLVITKQNSANKVDVMVTIATLQPKPA